MEQLGRTNVVAFAKTGTLTEGSPRIAHVQPIAGMSAKELIRLAASAERPSEHPLAAAILTEAHRRRIAPDAAGHFVSRPGQGVTAVVAGRRVAFGSPDLLRGRQRSPCLQQIQAAVAAIEEAGSTAVVVVVDDEPAGTLALVDRLRRDAADAVHELGALVGRRPLLLTGDNAGAARMLAAEVGINEVHAELLPEDKVQQVKELQAGDKRVLVVGDGVNDAPALAAADLGIAMGRHGSDLALETADAVIVRDELSSVAKAINLSRRARRLVTTNLIIAGTVITSLVIWDLVGHLPLPLGVAGHEGSTVLVGLNGLRLLRNSSWREGAQH
jgi:P-type E1-E2 ATPase